MENVVLYGFMLAACSIILDFLLGVILSIKNKEFDLSKLPQFLATNFFPYIGGLGIVALMAYFVPEFEYLFFAGAGFVALKFGKEALVEKFRQVLQ